ncbi:MATE family efflux transporter [Treponema vincentii]|uniref:MATE family efflux transporter n=1 Tax=Treponema vincentii TaxID=69710 RepID=UPI0020A5431A|nr:MATE family efflux transporter [Treponema vincentii]UTC46279.1 MATE family efflux transporter [Treponema vincentii]
MKTFLKQSTEARRELILTANPVKTLLILSLPSLLMNTVQAMMPFTDGLFINNLTGYAVTGAVTFSQPIISMILGLSQGLSVAAMAIIGQLNGKGAIEEGKRVATQIFVFAVMLGIISAPLLLIISVAVSRGLQSDIAPYVRQYIAWYSIVLPFSFLESVYNGIKNANGKPEAAFTRMTILFVLKVIGNSIFLYILRLEILGCVLASLLANVCITIWMVYELFIHKDPDRLSIKNFKFDSKIIKEVLKVGFPAMFNYSFLYLGFFLINKEIERYGAVVVAAQGIASNINALCFNLPAAFSAAITTMVSMHIGAGCPEKAKRDCLLGCITSIIIAIVLIAVMIPLAPYLTVLFRREPEIIEIANNALNIYTYSIIGFGICMTIQGAFIGLGKTKMPLMLGVLRIWLLRYIFVLATEHALQYYAVFWGNLFSNIMTALIATVLILRTKWVSAISITTEQKE